MLFQFFRLPLRLFESRQRVGKCRLQILFARLTQYKLRLYARLLRILSLKSLFQRTLRNVVIRVSRNGRSIR